MGINNRTGAIIRNNISVGILVVQLARRPSGRNSSRNPAHPVCSPPHTRLLYTRTENIQATARYRALFDGIAAFSIPAFTSLLSRFHRRDLLVIAKMTTLKFGKEEKRKKGMLKRELVDIWRSGRRVKELI